ncbi:MAG: hypothetical protein ACTIKR_13835 [Advenella sp.]|uniref:Preprotein translocase subunit SecD n=1 Tax=Advenella kashmirensis TaxID=310575 RepID=A0A356LHQ5_9BURK|nr:hypothetical protein [Advenella kashmirensis]
MKLITLVMVAAVTTAVAGCSFFEKKATSGTVAATSAAPGSSATAVQATGAGNLEVYVGSTAKPKATKGKSAKTIPLQVGDQTYQGVGPILTRSDIKNVFVTKAGDRPALGLRVTPEGARKLNAEISGKAIKGKMVLASLNDSIFSTTIASPGAVDDGVLLMPMATLNNAKTAADIIRGTK